MLHLFFIVCLASNARVCIVHVRDRAVSPTQCSGPEAQIAAAKWQTSHPDWHVKAFGCTFHHPVGASA